MKESELRIYCLEHAGEKLSPEAEEFLAGDPELQKQVEQLVTVQKLISLKRYEQPSAASLQRCIRGVDEEIAKRRLSLGAIVREWITFEPQAVRYACAAAAVVVCAIGVSLLATKEKLSVDVAVQENAEAVMDAVSGSVAIIPEENPVVNELAASELEDIPQFDKPIIMLRVDSNSHSNSSGMTIGGGQVLPVSFEW